MHHHHSEAELHDRLWKEIEKVRYGMLGLVGRHPADHFQPMTAFCEPESGRIWFFSRTDADLAKAADMSRSTERGAEAMFTVQARDQGFQACIHGQLVQHFDQERMERFWNPVVAAWYPEGQNDPRLTLLRFDTQDAQLWLSETNPLSFGFQIVKANLTGHEPDVGESAPIDLRGPTAGELDAF
jgi:general stress protein 26